MTGSATEQPDVDMDSSLAAPAGQPGPTGSATEQPDRAMDSGRADPARPPDVMNHGTLKWGIQVDFNNGMWWAMPHELSDGILQKWHLGAQQVSFVWDWEKTRKGSFKPGGEETSYSRYIIDFDTMEQRNMDNGRTRKVQVVCVLP